MGSFRQARTLQAGNILLEVLRQNTAWNTACILPKGRKHKQDENNQKVQVSLTNTCTEHIQDGRESEETGDLGEGFLAPNLFHFLLEQPAGHHRPVFPLRPSRPSLFSLSRTMIVLLRAEMETLVSKNEKKGN